MNEEELAQLIHDEATHAYEHRNDPDPMDAPPPVMFHRSSIISVRFGDDELAAIKEAADKEHLPVATMIRKAALQAITEPTDSKIAATMERVLRTTMPELLAA